MMTPSPFASPFAAAPEPVSQGEATLVAFGFAISSQAAPASAGGLQRAATTGLVSLERQGSLSAALRASEAAPPPRRLAINCGRGRGAGTRVHRVPRIDTIREGQAAAVQQQRQQQPSTARAAEPLGFAAPAAGAAGAASLQRAPSFGLQRTSSATITIPW